MMTVEQIKNIAEGVYRDVPNDALPMERLKGLVILDELANRNGYKNDASRQVYLQKARLQLSQNADGNIDIAQHHIESGLILQTLANTSTDKTIIVLATAALSASSNHDILPVTATAVNDKKGALKAGRKRIKIVFDLQSNTELARQNLHALKSKAGSGPISKLAINQ